VEDKTMLISYIILFTGIGLLAFTFVSAFIFLSSNTAISASSDLIDVFGSSLAPLIDASIRIMYLGVMGWIGSGLTARGVQLIGQLKRLSAKPVESTKTPEVKETAKA
jgi:hypothetical protein